jgi:metal-responsive CopG/Arc/MetJ family transcriptional regulator
MKQNKLFEKRIIFFIGEDLLKQVDSAASKRGWKRSLLIREALKKYMKEEK